MVFTDTDRVVFMGWTLLRMDFDSDWVFKVWTNFSDIGLLYDNTKMQP